MTGDDLLRRIVSTIEDEDGRDASELPPLHHSVDVDALTALVESGADRIVFQHAGYRVEIVHGTVTIYDRTPREVAVRHTLDSIEHGILCNASVYRDTD